MGPLRCRGDVGGDVTRGQTLINRRPLRACETASAGTFGRRRDVSVSSFGDKWGIYPCLSCGFVPAAGAAVLPNLVHLQVRKAKCHLPPFLTETVATTSHALHCLSESGKFLWDFLPRAWHWTAFGP